MKKFLLSRLGMLILVIGGLFLIIILQRLGINRSLTGLTSNIFRPVQSFFISSATRIKDFFIYFKDINEIKKENIELHANIAALTAENFKLNIDIENSQIATGQLEFIKEHDFQSIIGKIIGRSSDQYLQVVIINKGDSDGLRVGYPAIINDGYIIGKIIATNSHTSKIQLLTDSQSEISALIQNETKSPGLVTGQFGITLKMQLIPQDNLISDGQLVVTSGIEQYIPANLIIGKITKITKINGELFQTADIESQANYQYLNIVTIIIPS